MLFTILTAVHNRRQTIRDAVRSLQAQTYGEYEHLIIDAGSTDGTLEILRELSDHRTRLFSEADDGIYDALNKGIACAGGDIVGLLHSDDFFASKDVLARVAKAFETTPDAMAAYGDLDYVPADHTSRVVRRWRAGEFSPGRLASGWMPPHPALFLRRVVFSRWGAYDTSYRIAGDYEAILRWFSQDGFRAVYIPEVLVKMRLGGKSNSSLDRILRKSREDYRAVRSNGIGGLGTLAKKNASKLPQFFVRPRASP